ncbi:MAG TPA: hypothetical protein VLV17_04225 [Anaeromyxobacteraceae bacterium]|nr:hypothetical protein [Anaeromyxobacteraceae bacterium]
MSDLLRPDEDASALEANRLASGPSSRESSGRSDQPGEASPFRGGFDVGRAAAEVRALIDPAVPSPELPETAAPSPAIELPAPLDPAPAVEPGPVAGEEPATGTNDLDLGVISVEEAKDPLPPTPEASDLGSGPVAAPESDTSETPALAVQDSESERPAGDGAESSSGVSSTPPSSLAPSDPTALAGTAGGERPHYDAADYGLDPSDPDAAAWAAWYAAQGWDPATAYAYAQQMNAQAPQDPALAEAPPDARVENPVEPVLQPPEPVPPAELVPLSGENESSGGWSLGPSVSSWDAPTSASEPDLAPIETALGEPEEDTAIWALPGSHPDLASAGGAAAPPAAPPPPPLAEGPTPELEPLPDLLGHFALESRGSFVAPPPAESEIVPDLPPLDLDVLSAPLPSLQDMPEAENSLEAPPSTDVGPPSATITEGQAVPPGESAIDYTAFDAEPAPGLTAAPSASEPTAMWGLSASTPSGPATEKEWAPVTPPAEAASTAPGPSAQASQPEALEILDEDILEYVDSEAGAPSEEKADEALKPARGASAAPAAQEPAPQSFAARPVQSAPPGLAEFAVPEEPSPLSAAPAEPVAFPHPLQGGLEGSASALESPPLPAEVPESPSSLERALEEEPTSPRKPTGNELEDLFADLASEAEPAAPPPPAPAEEPAPSPAPTLVIGGQHRVVIHTADGQVKRGILTDAALDGVVVLLAPQLGGAPTPVPVELIKAIFFMMPPGAQPKAPEGKRVRVTFRDGRQVAGFSSDYAPDRVGFFMVPVDTRTHTERIWVYRSAVRQVAVS